MEKHEYLSADETAEKPGEGFRAFSFSRSGLLQSNQMIRKTNGMERMYVGSSSFDYDPGIQREKIVEDAIAFVRALFTGNSDGHDFDHTMRVYHTAMAIADTEPQCDRLIVALAALLHDTDDSKLFSTEHNANARAFLDSQGIGSSMTEEICLTINSVSFSKNRGKRPESLNAMIVQDADRLDAIGAVGIARTFAYGGKHGRPLDSSIRHFYEKLLLLKDLMNTRKAGEMAEERHQFMTGFLDEWKRETE